METGKKRPHNSARVSYFFLKLTPLNAVLAGLSIHTKNVLSTKYPECPFSHIMLNALLTECFPHNGYRHRVYIYVIGECIPWNLSTLSAADEVTAHDIKFLVTVSTQHSVWRTSGMCLCTQAFPLRYTTKHPLQRRVSFGSVDRDMEGTWMQGIFYPTTESLSI